MAQPVTIYVAYTTNFSNAGEELVGYTPGSKLSIDDFKGAPVEHGRAAAITHSGIVFSASFQQQSSATLHISVGCSFDRQKSWMKASAKTPYILAHEQHHFDITYLGAITLVQRLRNTTFTRSNYRTQLEQVYQRTIAEMQQLQEQYDTDTGHGTLPAEQAAWNKHIDTQLASLTVATD